MVQVQELEGCIASMQEQLEQKERAHAIRVNRLQQQLAQADDLAETVNRMKEDELHHKVLKREAAFPLTMRCASLLLHSPSRLPTGSLLQEVMESSQGDLSIVQERCLMLERRNEALTRELQAVKASGWSAVRDAEDKTTTIAEMSAQQKELEQQISIYQQRLAERYASALAYLSQARFLSVVFR
jgi:hypothetical protein